MKRTLLIGFLVPLLAMPVQAQTQARMVMKGGISLFSLPPFQCPATKAVCEVPIAVSPPPAGGQCSANFPQAIVMPKGVRDVQILWVLTKDPTVVDLGVYKFDDNYGIEPFEGLMDQLYNKDRPVPGTWQWFNKNSVVGEVKYLPHVLRAAAPGDRVFLPCIALDPKIVND